ncbi:MAG TPA: archease [Solirubrobacterales bacterium]|nr:archease [Solirubrobacterales bacterium]
MYRWVEHRSEIELLIEDDSPEAVLTEALVALGDILSEARGGEPVTHEVELSASDLPTLLAAWMKDLVYRAAADGFIPERVVRIELDDTTLSAVVAGERSVPQSLIKAVTYHRLELSRDDRTWHARVILDV